MVTELESGSDLYGALTEHWAPEETHTRQVGGMNLTYVTGEQVTTRLNEVLGVGGWSFKILEHGLNAEADEVWVLGEIVAHFTGHEVTRQQFGSQKIKRRRDTGVPLDMGFDLKGATTDAMKKCASLLGVGLYLSERSPAQSFASNAQGGDTGFGVGNGHTPVNNAPPVTRFTPPQFQPTQPVAADEDGAPIWCTSCQAEITPIYFKGGDVWSPAQMASRARAKYGRPLCMNCYKSQNYPSGERNEQQPALTNTGNF